MKGKEFVQLSRDEIHLINRSIAFAMGVLELFQGHGDDELCNGDSVLLEAQNKLYEIKNDLEEKLDHEEAMEVAA